MSQPNIWIFSLEPLDSRYTAQWHAHIPDIIAQAAGPAFRVRQIDGVQRQAQVTAGAFLNFSDTNYWKSSQLCKFVELLDAGEVTAHDRMLFTDAWNPCITQMAYMRDLLGQHWQMHGIWHAGAYDPSDILGYKMQKPWPWYAESSWFHSLDYNYYATDFHKDMFLKNLDIAPKFHDRAIRSGQPHGLIVQAMSELSNVPKRDQIMWPHRFNQDKQPDIAVDLKSHFDMVITQQMSLSKTEYYDTMAASKIIFSCALHENLGISVMEGVLAGAMPVVPDRCSYAEMYLPEFKYPSAWTANWSSYLEHRDELQAFIQHMLDHAHEYQDPLERQRGILMRDYLNASVMVEKLTQP